MRSSVGCTTNTSESEFSVHTGAAALFGESSVAMAAAIVFLPLLSESHPNRLTGAGAGRGEVHEQTMIPRDEIPKRERPPFALRSQRANVISPSRRGLHRGQRCKPR